MTASIPKKEPDSFVAGDTVKWTKYLSDYLPSDGWTLKYIFVSDAAQETVTGTDNGDGSHLLTIAAATSAGYAAGIQYWQAYVTDGTDRYKVAEGRVEVKPDFESQTNGYDARSHIKKVLDALEATILGKASKDQMSYSIAGRSLDRMEPGELIKWHNHYQILYKQELQAEGMANGDAPANKGQVRF